MFVAGDAVLGFVIRAHRWIGHPQLQRGHHRIKTDEAAHRAGYRQKTRLLNSMLIPTPATRKLNKIHALTPGRVSTMALKRATPRKAKFWSHMLRRRRGQRQLSERGRPGGLRFSRVAERSERSSRLQAPVKRSCLFA